MGYWDNFVEMRHFVGKTFSHICTNSDEEIIFECTDGSSYKMYHEQDWCENVSVEDICGDLEDIIGHEILLAEEVSEDDPNADESGTWTFYKFSTIKGAVTVRWYGRSNGYYSESVSIREITEEE